MIPRKRRTQLRVRGSVVAIFGGRPIIGKGTVVVVFVVVVVVVGVVVGVIVGVVYSRRGNHRFGRPSVCV